MSSVKIDKKIVSWKLNTKQSFKDNHALKRPKTLTCSIHQVKVKGEVWTILIGLYDGKPYEVFGGLSKFTEIPKKYKNGVLVKNEKKNGISTYDLVCEEGADKFIVNDIVSVFENTTQGAFTRLISLSLRHGAPVNFVVEQLIKDQYSDITSFNKVIARVLKTYIKEGIKCSAQCPKCESTNMIFNGGCPKCLDCNYTKCD